MLHVIFYGTQTFAVTILRALIHAPEISVDLAITQPDRPVGRKKIITSPPVKVVAEAHSIEVLQPPSLKKFALPRSFDLGITAQYGLLIPERLLSSPIHRTLNVHASLLPKYRGASPIQAAIRAGDTETGITIMQMDRGLDTGPILTARSIGIHEHETYPELEERLANIGSDLLLETIPRYVSGELSTTPQSGPSSYASTLTREDGRVDWSENTRTIYNQYRAFIPWPGIWTTWGKKRLKLLHIKPSKSPLPPGELRIEHDTISVGTSDGSIHISELQLEGKRPMSAAQFARHYGPIV